MQFSALSALNNKTGKTVRNRNVLNRNVLGMPFNSSIVKAWEQQVSLRKINPVTKQFSLDLTVLNVFFMK